MSYENSLTSSVNDYISGILAKKLACAQRHQAMVSAAKSVREYLKDPETLLTSDFVMRRHIQAHHPDLLPPDLPIPDLVNGGNKPWDKAVIDHVATLLFKATKADIPLKKKNWQDYLSGRTIQKREKLMQVAFALRMDVDTTMDLMLAVDAEPYNVRNPLDFICMFCQQEPGRYTWTEAMQMLEEFQALAGAAVSSAGQTTPGMSEELKNGLQDIFESYLGQTQSRKALVTYMVENAVEFGTGSLSHTRNQGILELAKALKLLYPIRWVTYNEKKDGSFSHYAEEVSDLPDGYPALASLAKAILQQNNWTDMGWQEEGEDKNLFAIWNTYLDHMMNMDRLRSGGNFAKSLNRQDVLLMIYFFITGYRELKLQCATGSGEETLTYHSPGQNRYQEVPCAAARLRQLEELHTIDTDFGFSFCYALRRLERIYARPEEPSVLASEFERLTRVVDVLLSALGFRELYLPAQLDRIVMLSLLSGNPEELMPLILSNLELESEQ